MNLTIISRATLASYLVAIIGLAIANHTQGAAYLTVAFSLAFGALFFARIINPQQKPRERDQLAQLEANLVESRKIVHQMTGGIFHYIATGSFTPDNRPTRFDLREMLGSPLIWITLLLVAAVMLVMPSDSYEDGIRSRLQFLGIMFLEFLLLSGGIAGLLLSVFDLFKRSCK